RTVGADLGADGLPGRGLVGEGGEVAVEGLLVRGLSALGRPLAVDARARGLGVTAVVAALAQRSCCGLDGLSVLVEQWVRRRRGGVRHAAQPNDGPAAGPTRRPRARCGSAAPPLSRTAAHPAEAGDGEGDERVEGMGPRYEVWTDE